jgi:hypothetical protein
MFCGHLLPSICFGGEFLSLGDPKKEKKPSYNSNKRIFWEENVPMLPDFDGKNSEIITFIQ